jgi:3-hydroxybutyryl-CoA dehydrogenase
MIQTVCVCGAGTMGSGIAQAVAQSGIATVLFDVNEDVLRRAESNIRNNLNTLVSKQKLLANDAEAVWQHLQFSSSINDCRANLIIEAIVENKDAKVALFQQLSKITEADTIFASNTSSLSITHLQQEISNPERVAGLHFFNPATIMKLVEVVKGEHTEDAVIQQLQQFCSQLNKTAVVCKDAPGFIVNRVARPYYIEALRLAEEGVGDYNTIDTVMESCGFKMGPFRLMDLIGNDVNYAVSCSVYEQLGKPDRLKPSVLQEEKVQSGRLGRKTGEGYYLYK